MLTASQESAESTGCTLMAPCQPEGSRTAGTRLGAGEENGGKGSAEMNESLLPISCCILEKSQEC